MQVDPSDNRADEVTNPSDAFVPVKRSRLFNPLLHAGPMLALPVLHEWLWWRLGGPSWIDFLTLASIALAIIYFCMGLSSVICLLAKSTRGPAAIVALCCIAAISSMMAGQYLTRQVSHLGKVRLIHQSQYILDAIRGFEMECGSTPTDLADLIPTYLAELPSTGILAFPKYEYTAFSNVRDEWSLILRVNRYGSGMDYLQYRPTERYLRDQSTGRVRYIENWGYKTGGFGKPSRVHL
ncbi:MAG: hypothetical protein ACI87O_001150 [Planctomycetota bacterium]|jgi:hypothetical protein